MSLRYRTKDPGVPPIILNHKGQEQSNCGDNHRHNRSPDSGAHMIQNEDGSEKYQSFFGVNMRETIIS